MGWDSGGDWRLEMGEAARATLRGNNCALTQLPGNKGGSKGNTLKEGHDTHTQT